MGKNLVHAVATDPIGQALAQSARILPILANMTKEIQIVALKKIPNLVILKNPKSANKRFFASLRMTKKKGGDINMTKMRLNMTKNMR
ncbi:hypothetical protein CQA66_05025 [Helicobacter aurati]|uniref:Uncharacterized protein n=1 Tax=Helicobacter aurati TaxID=137778 RepID=A0A3D8J5J9_9HELI|nr:hypothetical protein [Helicobacter aurati]RDU72425.1 hypothetical protein CQA66_05025 [Helicobacter aurati]